MKSKKKFKRKFSAIIVVLSIVAIGFIIGSSKLIRVHVNSETINSEVAAPNFVDSTASLERVSLNDIKNNSNKNVILFTSSWCGTCAKLKQDLSDFANTYPETNFYIMDLESDRETANTLSVPITPTLVLLENGKTKNYPEVTIDSLSTILEDFHRIGIR